MSTMKMLIFITNFLYFNTKIIKYDDVYIPIEFYDPAHSDIEYNYLYQ